MMGTVYLIHFSQALAHACHYIGYADNLERRLDEHESTRWVRLDEPILAEDGTMWTGRRIGHGSVLLGAVNAAQIPWFLARTWPGGDRNWERQLHNYKKSHLLCPICTGQAAYNRMKGVLQCQ